MYVIALPAIRQQTIGRVGFASRRHKFTVLRNEEEKRPKNYACRCACVECVERVERNRKYRWSQSSHRNGSNEKRADTIFSIGPFLWDLRTQLRPHRGQAFFVEKCNKPIKHPCWGGDCQFTPSLTFGNTGKSVLGQLPAAARSQTAPPPAASPYRPARPAPVEDFSSYAIHPTELTSLLLTNVQIGIWIARVISNQPVTAQHP